MQLIAYVFWIFIVLVGVSFALINSQTVTLHYYLGTVSIYVPLLLLVMLAVGAVLGILALLPNYFKLKSAIRKARQRIKQLESSVERLQSDSPDVESRS